jgi:hypothetical protein
MTEITVTIRTNEEKQAEQNAISLRPQPKG